MARRSKPATATTTRPDDLFVTQTHPLYDEWVASWRLAGENYEGDGGYLDGLNLIPHPREMNYQPRREGGYDFTLPIGAKQKLLRRRQLARYDNFAGALTDIFVDHQYAKKIARTFKNPKSPDENYLRWIENVDGDGTHLDDWLKERQTLAHTYGHLGVLMDRQPKIPGLRPRNRAEQPDLVLRDYIPPDMIDWLAPRRKITAVKFVEAVERASLREPSQFSSSYRGSTGRETNDDLNVEYLFWDQQGFEVYSAAGARTRTGVHGFGELPVVLFYSRRRSRIPVLGRPLLRDPRLFRDHYNLVSELRELLRSQTFSMLHVKLDPAETVDEAKGRMGDHAGTDTVLFTMGGADFIAPADGPVAAYVLAIDALERKMFRLLNLPWEGDSRDAESAESRRIKATDLDRALAGHADEAERADYGIARLFYLGFYGREAGLQRWQENPPIIRHPDTFNVDEVLAAVEDVKSSLSLQLGKTASTLLRKRVVPIVLPDLDKETAEKIGEEIEATPYNAAEAAGDFSAALADAAGKAA